jgi:hypothetical protein
MEPRSVNIYSILTSKLNVKSDLSYESKIGLKNVLEIFLDAQCVLHE